MFNSLRTVFCCCASSLLATLLLSQAGSGSPHRHISALRCLVASRSAASESRVIARGGHAWFGANSDGVSPPHLFARGGAVLSEIEPAKSAPSRIRSAGGKCRIRSSKPRGLGSTSILLSILDTRCGIYLYHRFNNCCVASAPCLPISVCIGGVAWFLTYAITF